MFDEILGLPAHALIIHFAVVLTPLLVVVAAAYALAPGWRPYTAWAVVLLSLASPVVVYAAKESGESLKATRFVGVEGETGARVATHESFANPLLLSVLGLAAVSLVLVYATRPARDSVGREAAFLIRPGVSYATLLVLAAVAGYYVFQAGDSGARAVWGM